MSINLNELIEQRAEATGVAGDRIPFEFGGKTFTFKDPLMLSDEEKDELVFLDYDADVAEWYMGAEQYEEFITTEAEFTGPNGKKFKKNGSSSFFNLVLQEHIRNARGVDEEGNPTMLNRSSRRAAARKRQKRR